ncbi:exodeoxyribonuclease VII small subunit [Nitrosomonas sp.]|uniref:exodeoxyribonuclease VII small subunit n=1 Tax=Nitrosomonas sp. TaxID=42353 RepID=UPI0025DA322D|nr:exodeoxyribonuclease VII small subunit [Nitrosomonas sp.]MCC6915740.1 exodeoxyribonuclease VII small subunit [Nitrosomonas sp.]
MKKKISSDTEAVAPPPPQKNFETATAELEKIIAGMEAGQISLEDALSAYKRGVELLQYCQNMLKDSQQQIKILEADMLKNFPLTERDAS